MHTAAYTTSATEANKQTIRKLSGYELGLYRLSFLDFFIFLNQKPILSFFAAYFEAFYVPQT